MSRLEQRESTKERLEDTVKSSDSIYSMRRRIHTSWTQQADTGRAATNGGKDGASKQREKLVQAELQSCFDSWSECRRRSMPFSSKGKRERYKVLTEAADTAKVTTIEGRSLASLQPPTRVVSPSTLYQPKDERKGSSCWKSKVFHGPLRCSMQLERAILPGTIDFPVLWARRFFHPSTDRQQKLQPHDEPANHVETSSVSAH